MNETLRDRILRKLERLSDERGYQALDYLEFLESRYAEKTAQAPNVFQRFAEGVEDSLRAGRVSASTIAETMGLLNRAMGVLGGVAAAGRSVATDMVEAATRSTARPPSERDGASAPTTPGTSGVTGAPAAAPTPPPPAEPAP